MSKGKRFDEDERRLNMKKVAAVIIAFLVIIMFIVGIKEIIKDKPNTNEKVFTLGYYTVYENGKWGVIDTKGNIVINPSYNDMIVIPDNTKPVFFILENVNYDDETYNTKVINEKNDEIFISYDKVELLVSHLVSSGSDAVLVNGTTGETPTLTFEEELERFTSTLTLFEDKLTQNSNDISERERYI